MSTLNVNKIADASGGVLAPISSVMRNRIINGAMTINQRAFSGAITADNTYTLDRWYLQSSQASKITVSQNAGSVTPPAGFANYFGVTSSSAYSVTSGDYFAITQIIEGFNTADLNFGSASAKTITLSAWVYSSLTGTFGGCVTNGAFNRSYPFTYTISSANTWTQISVTIAGDTTGTWVGATNGRGMYIQFGLGVGSTYNGTAGSWSANGYVSATGATSVVGTNGATFYITGVQLEVGTQATGFEYRQYGTEMTLCQRYYYKAEHNGGTAKLGTIYNSTLNRAVVQYDLPVKMRTAPTASYTIGIGTANSEYLTVDYVQIYLTVTTNGYLSSFAATAEL
jgi:hypothetical protein